VFHIAQSEALPVHLAQINSMCLHAMLCGSLGVIKFNIKLVVLYFFEKLLFLLILTCFVHYFRDAVDWYSYLRNAMTFLL